MREWTGHEIDASHDTPPTTAIRRRSWRTSPRFAASPCRALRAASLGQRPPTGAMTRGGRAGLPLSSLARTPSPSVPEGATAAGSGRRLAPVAAVVRTGRRERRTRSVRASGARPRAKRWASQAPARPAVPGRLHGVPGRHAPSPPARPRPLPFGRAAASVERAAFRRAVRGPERSDGPRRRLPGPPCPDAFTASGADTHRRPRRPPHLGRDGGAARSEDRAPPRRIADRR